MSEPMPLTRLGMPERRMLPVVTVGPYVLLVLLTVATVAIKHSAVGALRIDLALCGLAAAWIAWMFTLHPAWRVRPRPMAVFFVVFVAIMAILVLRDPWFGFLTPAGYFFARLSSSGFTPARSACVAGALRRWLPWVSSRPSSSARAS